MSCFFLFEAAFHTVIILFIEIADDTRNLYACALCTEHIYIRYTQLVLFYSCPEFLNTCSEWSYCPKTCDNNSFAHIIPFLTYVLDFLVCLRHSAPCCDRLYFYIESPPEISITCPVTYEALSETRKDTTEAISSGSP